MKQCYPTVFIFSVTHSEFCLAALFSSHVHRRCANSNFNYEYRIQEESQTFDNSQKAGDRWRNDKFGVYKRANICRINNLFEHFMVGSITNNNLRFYALAIFGRGFFDRRQHFVHTHTLKYSNIKENTRGANEKAKNARFTHKNDERNLVRH